MADLVQQAQEIEGSGLKGLRCVVVVDPDVAVCSRRKEWTEEGTVGVAPRIGIGQDAAIAERHTDRAGIGNVVVFGDARRNQTVPQTHGGAKLRRLASIEHQIPVQPRLASCSVARRNERVDAPDTLRSRDAEAEVGSDPEGMTHEGRVDLRCRQCSRGGGERGRRPFRRVDFRRFERLFQNWCHYAAPDPFRHERIKVATGAAGSAAVLVREGLDPACAKAERT
jgi:hypothetical protein